MKKGPPPLSEGPVLHVISPTGLWPAATRPPRRGNVLVLIRPARCRTRAPRLVRVALVPLRHVELEVLSDRVLGPLLERHHHLPELIAGLLNRLAAIDDVVRQVDRREVRLLDVA